MQPQYPHTSSNVLGGPEIVRWKQQAYSGSFSEIRKFIIQSRENCDWEDRQLVLRLLGDSIPEAVMDTALQFDNSVEMKLLRAHVLSANIGKARGASVAKETSREQFDGAARYVDATLRTVQELVTLDPGDPVPHTLVIWACVVFSNMRPLIPQAYQSAIQVAPGFVQAHMAMVNACSKKWGGSHEQSLQIARDAVANAQVGDDSPACVFMAHLLTYQYIAAFESNPTGAVAYKNNPMVAGELNGLFDRWAYATTNVRRCSIPYWHYPAAWYYFVRDRVRLQRALTLTNNTYSEWAWNVGDAEKLYADARHFALTGTLPTKAPAKKGLFDWLK